MTAISQSVPARLTTNLRAYLAGSGATGALIAAAVVAFLSLAAFVAFHGWPQGSSAGGTDSVYLGGRAAGAAPRSAGAALGGATRVVAPGPAAGAATATGGGNAGGGSTATTTPPTGPTGTITNPTDHTTQPPPACTDCATSPSSGPVGGAVQSVNKAVQDQTGQDPGLGQATQPVTGAVDNALKQLPIPVPPPTGSSSGGLLNP